MKYPTEELPDKDLFYRRIPKIFVGASISPSAFSFQEDGCSVNWEKYSTPARTRIENARNPPNYCCVGSLKTGNVRKIDLVVKLNPLPNNASPDVDNRTHCLIIPPPEIKKSSKALKYQVKLANLCSLISLE